MDNTIRYAIVHTSTDALPPIFVDCLSKKRIPDEFQPTTLLSAPANRQRGIGRQPSLVWLLAIQWISNRIGDRSVDPPKLFPTPIVGAAATSHPSLDSTFLPASMHRQ